MHSCETRAPGEQHQWNDLLFNVVDRIAFVYFGKFVMPNRPYKPQFADKSSTIYREMSRHVDEKVRMGIERKTN